MQEEFIKLVEKHGKPRDTEDYWWPVIYEWFTGSGVHEDQLPDTSEWELYQDHYERLLEQK